MAQVENYIVHDNLLLATELIENIQTEDVYETNYKQVIGLWLDANYPVIRDFTTLEISTLKNIAIQNSLDAGPAATMARIYLKMALDTNIYEPEPAERFGLGGWLQAEQCAPYYFANAQVSIVGENHQIDFAAIADSTGRFFIEPELLEQIPADATFDLIITTYNGDVYAMNKNQTLENWIMEPEVHLYKNCESATLVGLNKELTGMEQIKAYPIPTRDVLNITGLDIKMGYSIIITDVSGKELLKQQFIAEHRATIPTGAFDTGVYFANITNAAGITKTIKFVK